MCPEPTELHILQALLHYIIKFCCPAYGTSSEDTERTQKFRTPPFALYTALAGTIWYLFSQNSANLQPGSCHFRASSPSGEASILGGGALRNTRQDRRLNFPKTALEFGKSRFSYSGPKFLPAFPVTLGMVCPRKVFSRK